MKLAPLAAAAVALTLAGCGESSAADPSSERVREIVHEYLMENPEVIREALMELQVREQAAARDAVRATAVAMTPQILADERIPTLGPDDAKVTIIEFFDYNCGYCQLASEWVHNALEQNPNDVRVVFVDYPILNSRTGTSIEAAEAALSAAKQGKFKEMHFALYGVSGALTSEQIDAIAAEQGVDVAQMRTDMERGAHGELFADIMVMGEQMGVEGTPFFIINDQIVNGADIPGLDEKLAAALGS